MDTVTPVIDLGEFAWGRDREQGVQRRPWRSPRARRWLPVALVAAFVVPLAGAAPPASQPPLTPLWTVPGTEQRNIALTGDTLYAIERADGGGQVLARHDLATGALRWAAPLAAAGSWSAVELAAGKPVVISPGRGGAGLATGYDPATGEVRWRHEGWPARTVAGGRLVLDRWRPGPLPDGGMPPSDLVAVDIDTGEVAWTIQTAGDAQELYGWSGRPGSGTDPTVLITVGGGGRLTRYDLATGTEVAAAQLPPGQAYHAGVDGSVAAALFAQLQTWVFASELAHPAVADGLVMLTEPASAVAAYDLATLAPRWRLLDHGWAALCGPVVCAVNGELTELAAIDPDTGSVRWSWRCGQGSGAGESCYVLPTALGPGDPMLVQQWQLGSGGVDTAWLVEPATGAPVAELGQWRALGRFDSESWLLRWVDENEPVFGRGLPPERTWLARLTVDPPELEVLGSVEAPTCQPHRTYLVCWPGEQTDATVWRVF
jgi:outer membrane protein assembly factor BamB